MCSNVVVQHDDGTPTGSRSTSFFIRGILGPDAWSIFMRWLRRRAERFSVAASLVGHPRDGWRFRPGCSIGPLARPGVLAPLPMLTLRCDSRPGKDENVGRHKATGSASDRRRFIARYSWGAIASTI